MAVLDAEALSVLASPGERGSAKRRSHAVLEAVERRGGYAVVPAPVLAEVSRTRERRMAVERVLRHLSVVPTDRRIAEGAGVLLEAVKMSSSGAIDAFVVATASAMPAAVILTGDAGDIRQLSSSLPNVVVQPLG
ncbi:MAG: type II toxin-antitoxin system VapC family toxin [Acidimicrobiales bacterium]